MAITNLFLDNKKLESYVCQKKKKKNESNKGSEGDDCFALTI